MIEIDGAQYEGGGAILRVASALTIVTKKPCRVFNIRQGREKPGLMPQHLLGIRALARLCNGKLEGDQLGSQEIKLFPGEIEAKDLHIKIETAGSITLCLQSLLPVALRTPNPIKITFEGGGTDVPFSPTIDYFRYVFLRILEQAGAKAEVKILKRGYYPEGGAEVEVKVYPLKIKTNLVSPGRNFNLIERVNFKKITAISGASESLKSKKVAERQLAGVREILGKLKLPIEEKVEYYQTQCPGSQICLIAEFENTVIGADNLGKLGKRAEDIGKEAALELLKEQKSGASLDKHLADQILPFMALASSKSSVTVSEITNHCKTNIWVIEKFIKGKFEIRGNLISWLPRKI